MVLQLFIISQDEITEVSPAQKLSPQDVGLVYHEESRNLYVFKGEDSLVLDEFQSEILYDRILNRFLNTNIYFLQSLIPTSENSPEILEVKAFFYAHLAGFGFYSLKKIGVSVLNFRRLRNRIKMFKNFETSHSWRAKLTHPRKFWQLELFNLLMGGLVFLLLILQLLLGVNPIKTLELTAENWFYWLENLQITLGVCLGLLSILVVVNGIFLLFPMKYPTQTTSSGKLTKEHRKKLHQLSQDALNPPKDQKT